MASCRGFGINLLLQVPKFLLEFNHLRFLFSFIPPKYFLRVPRYHMQVPYQLPGEKKKFGIMPDIVEFDYQERTVKKVETMSWTSIFGGASIY